MHYENLLGLPLDLARKLLTPGQEAIVVQSSPPFLPRGYTPHWGDERVVRVRTISEGQIVLLVARELVGEERQISNDKRAAGKDDASR